ncbi:hypothetical protein BH20ACT24_BH20ACT24_16070 [soil metagenome]
MHRTLLRHAWSALLALTMASTLLGGTAGAAGSGGGGAVYVETNTGANAIVVFDRATDGTLTEVGAVPTGGAGTNSALGSQGAVILSVDGHRLFAVNAGSNQISSFAVSPDGLGLELVDLQSSRGLMPISLTLHGDVLYVLNALGLGNIVGFRVADDGTLTSLSGSKRKLSAPLSNPAQVQFNPSGTVLMVTEKGTRLIDTFPVDENGVAGPLTTTQSSGLEPFGFAFDPAGHAIVSEAFAGAPGRSAVSSYAVTDAGEANVISASVPNQQTAACWVVITSDGHFAFVSNTGSGNISSYAIGNGGQLSLDEAVAARTGKGSAPTDMDLDEAGHMYVLASGFGMVRGFAVGSGGNLLPITKAGALPASATGLAAR